MQSKSTQKHYKERRRFEDSYTSYPELARVPITMKLIMGTIMHRCNITFQDGNKFELTLHKIGDNINLAHPKMWEYPMEKMAILDYLSNLAFFNDSFTITEQSELYKHSKELDTYRVAGELALPSHIVYGISTETFHEKHFVDYDIRVESKVAKNFKFPVKHLK